MPLKPAVVWGAVIRQIKLLLVKGCQLEFNSQNPHKGGRRELTPNMSSDLHVCGTNITHLTVSHTYFKQTNNNTQKQQNKTTCNATGWRGDSLEKFKKKKKKKKHHTYMFMPRLPASERTRGSVPW